MGPSEHQPRQDTVLNQIADTLEQLLLGKPCDLISARAEEEVVQRLVESANKLIVNLQEINHFAVQLARGELDIDTPNRRNYIAAALKELHSQLSNLAWKAQLLKAGQMVSKLDSSGELYDAFNSLVERVAEISRLVDEEKVGNWEWSANSWRYHQLLSALNHLDIMVVEADEQGKVVYANHPARIALGQASLLREDALSEDCGPLLRNLARNSSDTKEYPVYHEFFDDTIGSWYKITSDRVTFPDGHTGYLHMVDDISEWKKHERKLQHTAQTDGLTGTYNRKTGMGVLERLLRHPVETDEHCAAFIDVDHLKLINDRYGHAEGDYAILAISKILLSSIRDSDTVSRYGGDEFLVIFQNCPLESAERIMERMHARLEEINRAAPKPYDVSFSYGVVSFHADSGKKAMDVVELIDKKMYEQKSERKKHQTQNPAAQ